MADEAKESEPKSELPPRRQAAELQEFALTVRESFTFSTSLWLLLSLLLGLFPSLYDSSTENNNFSDRLPLTFTLFYLGSCISSIYRQPIPDPYGIIDERWTENLNKLQERVPKLIGMTQKTQILYLVFNLFFLKTGLYPFLVQLTGEIFITKRNQSRAEDNEELNRQLKEFLEKHLPDSFTVEEIEDEIPKKTQSLYEYLRDFIPTKTVFTALIFP
ncbi:hypothetical protein [Candidiatus Paracoxiella cheracis]|uniref:hypothetical protein n=1 Tax=Candidiatus Paracoxiella cheracis TaxID=3405120 RepID=UPI003BF5364F